MSAAESAATIAAASQPRAPLALPAFRALVLAQACFGVAYSIFLILPKFLAAHLGAGSDRVGLVMASFGVANVLAAPLVAGMVQRLGARRTFVAGTTVMAVAAFGFASVSSAGPLAFACRALQGVAWALVFSAGGALVAELAAPERLTTAIAIHSTANLMTNALGPAVGEPALERHGAGIVFGAAGVMAVLSAALVRRIGPAPSPSRARVRATQADGRLPARPLVVGAVLGLACGVMFTFHQPLALARGATRVSDFLVAYTLAAVCVRLFLSRVGDRLGARRIAFVSFVYYGVIVTATVLMGARSLALFGALYGLAHGSFFPSYMALALQSVPSEARDRLLAWVNAVFNLGLVAVAPLGWVAAHAGWAAVFVPVGALTVATALWARGR